MTDNNHSTSLTPQNKAVSLWPLRDVLALPSVATVHLLWSTCCRRRSVADSGN